MLPTLFQKKSRETHVGVFGHWVELEEKRALNDFAHLPERRERKQMHTVGNITHQLFVSTEEKKKHDIYVQYNWSPSIGHVKDCIHHHEPSHILMFRNVQGHSTCIKISLLPPVSAPTCL